jgi:hypothetical protein
MKKAFFLGLAIATSIIITSLFVPLSTLAKAEQTCPVTIQGSLHFANQASQPVSAIIFHAVRVNAMGEEVKPDPNDTLASIVTDRSEQTWLAKKTGLQPGEKAHAGSDMSIYGRPNSGDTYMLYVRAVKFADGATWKDDGSHSCQWTYHR